MMRTRGICSPFPALLLLSAIIVIIILFYFPVNLLGSAPSPPADRENKKERKRTEERENAGMAVVARQ